MRSLISPVIVFSVIAVFSGCAHTEKKDIAELNSKIDSLQAQIAELKVLLNEKQLREKEPVQVPQVKPETVPEPVHKPVVIEEEKERIFYYKPETGVKKVSVKISPWKEGRRKMILYDPAGNVTFEREDVRMSYSDTATIERFHDNGAVAVLNIHLNPGASMYWYDTSITFSAANEPEWKTATKHPSTLEELMDNKYYWDKKEKVWKKQEIIKEQPVPESHRKTE